MAAPPRRTAWAPRWSACSCRLALHELVEDRGDDDRDAEEQLDVEAGCVAQDESVLDGEDEGRSHDHAGHRATATGERAATDDGGRDGKQRVALRRTGLHSGRASDVQRRGDADHETEEGEGLQAYSFGLDRDGCRRGRVAPDSVELVSGPMAMQEEPGCDADEHEPDQLRAEVAVVAGHQVDHGVGANAREEGRRRAPVDVDADAGPEERHT